MTSRLLTKITAKLSFPLKFICRILLFGLLSLDLLSFVQRTASAPKEFPSEERDLASEGLHGNSVPPAIITAWKATAMLTIKDKKNPDILLGTATAFAVKKEFIDNDHVRITFLTNDHNINGPVCGESHDCKNAELSIAFNYALNMKDNTIDKIAEPAFEVPLKMPEQKRTDNKRDLALVTGIFSKAQAEQFEIINLSCEEGCQTPGNKIFLIGFPAVQHRLSPFQETPIDDGNRIKKRWSEGYITAESFKTDAVDGEIPMGTSTADSLKGNSGSPLVAANGQLCGVYTGGWIDGSDHYKYEGDDGTLKFHSVHTTCEELKKSAIITGLQSSL